MRPPKAPTSRTDRTREGPAARSEHRLPAPALPDRYRTIRRHSVGPANNEQVAVAAPVKSKILHIRTGVGRVLDFDRGYGRWQLENSKRRHHRMANKDDFRLVLSDRPKLPKQPDTGTARRRAVVSTPILKVSLLVVTAAGIAFAIVLLGNPHALFSNGAAVVTGAPTPQDSTSQDQDGIRQEMPAVQSATDNEASPPPATDASADNETVPASNTAGQTDNAQAPSQALLSQFKAWAASQDTRAEIQPMQPAPAQEDRAASAAESQAAASPQDTMPVTPPAQRRQPAGRVKNAQAGAKPNRAKLRPDPNAQLYFRSTPLREPDPPVPTARPPSFLESLRSHN